MSRKKRRSFSDTQKADAVRRHLKDHVPVSQIANDLDVQPTMIHNWIKTALEQIEVAFNSPRAAKKQASKQETQLQQLRQKLDAKNEVIAELMEENIRSIKENGELSPVAGFLTIHETRLSITSTTGKIKPD